VLAALTAIGLVRSLRQEARGLRASACPVL
jgi:hypothetical protein